MDRSVLAIAALLWTATPTQAQELVPMATWMAQPEADQEPSYAYIRCAGLYAGILFYLGEGAEAYIGTAGVEHFSDAISNLGVLAVWIRAERANLAPDSDAVIQSVLNDEFAIATLYEQRISANYQATGAALTNDPLIVGDLQACQSVAATAQQWVGGEQG